MSQEETRIITGEEAVEEIADVVRTILLGDIEDVAALYNAVVRPARVIPVPLGVRETSAWEGWRIETE